MPRTTLDNNLTDGTYKHMRQGHTVREVIRDAEDWITLGSMDVLKDTKQMLQSIADWRIANMVRKSMRDSGGRETACCNLNSK